MKKRVLRLAGVAISGAVAIGFAGCTAVDHVSIGLDNGKLRFAYCREFAPNRVSIDVSRDDLNGAKYHEVWVANGPESAGMMPVDYGVDPPGFTTKLGPEQFDISRSVIAVGFNRVSKTGEDESDRVGVFNGRQLVEGKWLNWNGKLVSSPCTS